MSRAEPALMNARTPITQALQAIAVMALKPNTQGARKTRTPTINGRYSTMGFHRNSSEPPPSTKSKAPPTERFVARVRQHRHRQISSRSVSPKAGERGEPVDAWQLDIQKDDIKSFLARPL